MSIYGKTLSGQLHISHMDPTSKINGYIWKCINILLPVMSDQYCCGDMSISVSITHTTDKPVNCVNLTNAALVKYWALVHSDNINIIRFGVTALQCPTNWKRDGPWIFQWQYHLWPCSLITMVWGTPVTHELSTEPSTELQLWNDCDPEHSSEQELSSTREIEPRRASLHILKV